MFKKGDKVKVREDLEVRKVYGGKDFVSDMKKLCGKVVTIAGVKEGFLGPLLKEGGAVYSIEEDCGVYYWTEKMFEEGKVVEFVELKETKAAAREDLDFETVIKVLSDIKEYCDKRTRCVKCRFYNGEDCGFIDGVPSKWKLNTEKNVILKFFEEEENDEC